MHPPSHPQRSQRLFLYEYLSGGGWVEQGAASLMAEGCAMREALAAELRWLPGWQLSVAATEPGPGHVLPHGGESPPAFVQRQAAAHDWVWVIAPETAGLLAQLRAAVPAGVGWLGCEAAAIQTASLKSATCACLQAAGLPVPRAGLDPQGRWVVKPDDGAGSVATRVHADVAMARADHARRLDRGETARLEPWVAGQALSLSLWCQATGVELLSVNHQHLQLDAQGLAHCEALTLNILPRTEPRWLPLQGLAQAVHQALPGLRGFVGVDLVWHPEAGPVLIEVNPRVTSALVGLSAVLGRPLVQEILQGFVHAQ
jgi:tyramine---L-glutamate ligase